MSWNFTQRNSKPESYREEAGNTPDAKERQWHARSCTLGPVVDVFTEIKPEFWTASSGSVIQTKIKVHIHKHAEVSELILEKRLFLCNELQLQMLNNAPEWNLADIE